MSENPSDSTDSTRKSDKNTENSEAKNKRRQSRYSRNKNHKLKTEKRNDPHSRQNRKKLNPKAASWQPKNIETSPSVGYTCIICADTTKYVAVGQCDHLVCSVCAIRMRLKNSEMNCAVCKSHLEHMVVYEQSCDDDLRHFASFGLIYDEPTPGVQVEHRSRMLFHDCRSHFTQIQNLISLSCPKCGERHGTEKALFKHVSTVHHLQFCELCFVHRPLFPKEQRLMTAAEIKAHVSAPPGALVDSSGDKTGGHPLCRFCGSRHYDAQALYVHMRDQHLTCHLCPARLQQRFYRGLPELTKHLNISHYVCSICMNPRRPVGDVVAFSRRAEYTEHMRCSHGIISASSTGGRDGALSEALTAAFSSSRPRSGGEQDVEYLDLNMASADPYLPQNTQTGGQLEERVVENAHRFIESERSLVRDEGHRGRGGRTHSARRETSSSTPSAARRTTPSTSSSDFPALSSSQPSNSSTGSAGNSTTSPHPLSLVPTLVHRGREAKERQKTEEAAKARERELAVRRGQRNLALAAALGLDTMALSDVVRVSGGSHNELDASVLRVLASHPLFASVSMKEVAKSSGGGGVTLRRPLFPVDLVEWGREHKSDLLKTEKRIYDMIADAPVQSCQLKPMRSWSRNCVQMLAKYYYLNATEFNQHEKRYVSLVKTADSAIPATILSAAASGPPLQHPIEYKVLDSVAENVADGLVFPFVYFLVTTGGVGSTLGDFLKDVKVCVDGSFLYITGAAGEDDRIIHIECIGYALVKVALSSLAAAKRLFRCVTNSSELASKFLIRAHFLQEDDEEISQQENYGNYGRVDENVVGELPPPPGMTSNALTQDTVIPNPAGECSEQGEDEWDQYPPEYMEHMGRARDKWDIAFQTAVGAVADAGVRRVNINQRTETTDSTSSPHARRGVVTEGKPLPASLVKNTSSAHAEMKHSRVSFQNAEQKRREVNKFIALGFDDDSSGEDT
mmetsp:Transcript_5526/g.8415  ORF Transcript_5526/g.8415 Transcript_5526/m.8415 type:complete len:964 (+) Transcript_5526:75-2966(+)